MDLLKSNDRVLFVWDSNVSQESVKDQVTSFNQKVTSSGKVHVENAEMLLNCEY